MNKVILVTGSNYSYLPKISGYLTSIDANSNFDKNFLIYTGEDLVVVPESVQISTINHDEVVSKNTNYCLQHGAFVNSSVFDKNTNDSDVIIFTDGDIRLQRGATYEELSAFRSMSDFDVMVGFNESSSDNLFKELNRLSYNFFPSFTQKDELESFPCYNTGVLAMNKKTWRFMLSNYDNMFEYVDRSINFYAKQQWLISYILSKVDLFNVINMSSVIHSHNHYPPPPEVHMDENGVVFCKNDVVLFKHKWDIA